MSINHPIRTSTLPSDPNSTATSPSQIQKQILEALLHNNGHTTVENVLSHELAASGWTTNLRTYVQMLLRSGECTTFNEAMERVLKTVGLSGKNNGGDPKEVNGISEAANGVGPSSGAGLQYQPIMDMESGGQLKIPDKVVNEGIKVARKELDKVCDIEVDDI